MATYVCDHCGNTFERRPAAMVSPHKYCGKGCFRAAKGCNSDNTTGLFKCAACKERLPRDAFDWYVRNGNPRRFPYCHACKPEQRKKYKVTGYSLYRDRWIKRTLGKGGDAALAWYFSRNLTQYKARSRKRGLPSCNVSAEYLVELFHEQEGRCYYTGAVLVWDTYGNMDTRKDSMSVDRLDPLKGYVRGNVVLCTYQVNTSKGARTEAEFYAFCEQVLQVRQGRGSPSPSV